MNVLDQILAHLDAYEKSEFVAHVEKHSSAKLELELIKTLIYEPHLESEEIKKIVYTKKAEGKEIKRDRYNSLRKSVRIKLDQWIVTTRMDSERSSDGKLYSLIIIAGLMLERNAVETAAYIFREAEKLAMKDRNYGALDNIYSLVISHAVVMKINMDDIIKKWDYYSQRHIRMNDLKKVEAKQKFHVSNAKKEGRALTPELSLKSIHRKIELTIPDANDPAFMERYCQIIRTSVASGKDYTAFERFVSRIYRRLKVAGILTDKDRELELGFLYMYAHAAYRNRKFDLCLSLCADMTKLLGERGARQHPIYPKYMALRASAATNTGRNAEAIELMEHALKSKAPNTEVAEWLNNRINLAVYYFQAENYKKANRTLRDINLDSSHQFTFLGDEWCFKKDTIELIVQYELGNTELSLKMCDQVSERYQKMLGQSIYQRAQIFLGFVRRLLKNPEEVSTPEFMQEVKNAQLAWPGDKEDVQAITFFCWLRAKMQKRKYYDVLLERMRE